MALDALLLWLEQSPLSSAIRSSLLLTAGLSALHAVALAVTLGGALLYGLRSAGLLFPEQARDAIVPAARHMLWTGVAFSTGTGGLLLLPRIAAATANGIFQFKMIVLTLAVVTLATWTRGDALGSRAAHARAKGLLAIVLWSTVAAAGAAYILLEGAL